MSVRSDSAKRAVAAFAEHVQAHARIQGSDRNGPSKDEIDVRIKLMQDMTKEMGLTRTELQNELDISPSTWDRWRKMSTTPHRSHFAALERMVADSALADVDDKKRPPPLSLLSNSPFTWGQLRFVYSSYQWENAIFRFPDAFYDADTATEMALIASRGCSIIYVIPDAKKWGQKFIMSMVRALGRNAAARSLTRIAAIDTNETIEKFDAGGFFNWQVGDPEYRVGYTLSLGAKKVRPPSDTRDFYRAQSYDSDAFQMLNGKYAESLTAVLKYISKNMPEDFWATIHPDDVDEKLTIPVFKFNDDDRQFTSKPTLVRGLERV